MTDKLKQTIKEEVGKLLKENQEVISNFGWEKIVEEVGRKYLLSDSEVNDLQVETLLVLIGLQDPDLYGYNIEHNVGTSKNEAEKIAEEILQKIFIPITNILIENIKKSGKHKNANAEQNLNFILSDGDYSAFVNQNSPLEEYPSGGGGQQMHPPRLSATPQEGNNIPNKIRKIEDIKSRFTI